MAMKQILVFQTPDISDEVYTETTDEKEILYNNLSNLLKHDIDNYHFKRFLDMENQISKSKQLKTQGIPSIIAKELIKYVKPLIIELPESQQFEKVNIFKKKSEVITTKLSDDNKWILTLPHVFLILLFKDPIRFFWGPYKVIRDSCKVIN